MGKISQLFTFKKGGIHPPEHKDLSEGCAIEEMPLPSELAILLGQHIGAPATATVKKGDVLTEGQVIGEVTKGLGVPVHSSCAGKVKNIGNAGHPLKIMAPAVIIEPDKEAARVTYTEHEWADLDGKTLLGYVKDAGIVGAGGAGFPTHAKLTPPPGMTITELVVNGAECEPYLTADHRLMLERAPKIIEGIRILMKILGVKKALVGIENNKPDAIEKMAEAAKDFDGIEICPLKTKYPQGGEKQLIYALTGRRIASGALPASVGVVVVNVATSHAVYEAVVLRKPMYERVVTVSGLGIKKPANLMVRVGTRISDIVEYLGGTTENVKKVIMGGPMMGFATSDLSTPTTKTTSGILFLTEEEVDLNEGGPCVRCGWCLDACPMGLEPKEIALYVEAGKGRETERFGVKDCFECGSCAFMCPAKRPLVQLIRLAKQQLRK
ncbi:MAG: electron transport complex subunit RsxC [Proteobacteria bacterium]|nr:electron transport complex subunit RsxC [Pseudomonadota bacterium]MBQ4360688.1 electron transport complex subunit RsxC [Pseudomonadota bacterium]